MPFADHAIIAGAGIVAGAINAVAGGGTLLTFPVLVALGRDPVLANATNALSLWPGSLAGAYALRREAWQARDLLFLLLPISVIGSFAGGVLLLQTPTRVFSGIVPFLVLGATLLLALQKQIARALPQAGDAAPSTQRKLGLMAAQLAVSIYGGYFGAAAGILMLAALGVFGLQDIHQRNGVKNSIATINNGVAGIYFLVSGAVRLDDALVLSVSAMLGGYLAGRYSRGLSRQTVETFVLVIGALATVVLLLE